MKRLPSKKHTPRGPRPVWKGFLRLGLASVPVKAIAARAKDGADIELNWIHEACHSQIRMQKVCPIHGEVHDGEIVSGFRVGKNDYVVIEPEELAKLRVEREDTIRITVAVPPDAIDRMYYTDKSYFLLPDGEARSYIVFLEALEKERCYGVATAFLFRREHLMLIRPVGGVLVMTSLTYPDHLKEVASIAERLPKVKTSLRELTMARDLISQLTDPEYDFAANIDPFGKRLRELVDAKLEGRGLKIEPVEEEPTTLNFVEALKRSLTEVQKRQGRSGSAQRRESERRHRRVS